MSGRRLRGVLVAAALFLMATAQVALACPACAGRQDGGPALFSIYATMVIAPFFAVAIAWRLIRSLANSAPGTDAAPLSKRTHYTRRPRGMLP